MEKINKDSKKDDINADIGADDQFCNPNEYRINKNIKKGNMSSTVGSALVGKKWRNNNTNNSLNNDNEKESTADIFEVKKVKNINEDV